MLKYKIIKINKNKNTVEINSFVKIITLLISFSLYYNIINPK